MSRPLSANRPEAAKTPTKPRSGSATSVDTVERLRRWAELVAVGEVNLPTELSRSELRIVLVEVARLRRQRLVRLVARAIALDISGDGEP